VGSTEIVVCVSVIVVKGYTHLIMHLKKFAIRGQDSGEEKMIEVKIMIPVRTKQR
jgi:hypothetical protein